MCPAPPCQTTSSATNALSPAPLPPQSPRPRPGSVVLRATQVSRLIPAAPPAPSAPQIPSAAASPDSSPPQTAPSSPATTPAFQKIQILRSEEHTSELQSRFDLVCRLLLEKKKKNNHKHKSFRGFLNPTYQAEL